ncbi:TIGR02646 family protein [Stenotrophomonas maltophilia]|uniref:retron system putative HNH endonuclease n=1 Tax=Stenotrophomonas lactitubi TaxID=2045214 RepID=UPI0020411910|nr:retron system putative HNH endonuclease [Stenotrophomonas lactitubi]MCO7471136.1 TIGR02646 family protein [Stenotrophomonas maltophilia]
MRSISKGQEPEAFTAWKARATAEWVPSYGILQNPEKTQLHVALIAEQLGTCCYCGRTITVDDSHIEHFAPQEHYQPLALDFANLHASCMRGTLRGDPLHCGHGKGSDFDPHCAIAPTDAGSEARFSYNRYTGAISPAEPSDASAQYMIELLKLDISFLRSRRLETLEGMFDDDFEATASVDELERLAQQAASADPEGRRVSFGHVLARHARALIALKQQAA